MDVVVTGYLRRYDDTAHELIGGVKITAADLDGCAGDYTRADHKVAGELFTGMLLYTPGHFMWLRPDPDNPLREARRFEFVVDPQTAHTSTTDLHPEVLTEPGLRVLLGILEPTLSSLSRGRRDGADTWWMHAQGGSWIEIIGRTVTQGGPQHLWPVVEYAVAQWRRLGKPGRGRYGLTVTTNGKHRYWLDQPDQAIAFTHVSATRPDLTEEPLR